MIKRIAGVFILTVLCSIMVFSTSAAQSRFDEPVPLGVAEDLIEGYTYDGSAVKDVELNERQTLRRIYYNYLQSIDKSKFAGAYFDIDDGDLHILLTDISLACDVKNEKVFFHEVQYSYDKLNEFSLILSEKLKDRGFICIGNDIQNNKIYIQLNTETFTEKANVLDEISSYIPKDSFSIEYIDDTISPTVNVQVQNGAELIGDNGTASVGCPISWYTASVKYYGFLTAGHFTGKDDAILYNGNIFGYTKESKVSGNCDAAVIARETSPNNYYSSPYVPDGKVINFQESPTADPLIEGDTIYYYGKVSGSKTGTITDNSCRISFNGNIIIETVKIDNVCEHGDSGGPVLIESVIEPDKYKIIGIITARVEPGTPHYMYFSRMKNIRNSFDSLTVSSFY